MRLAAACGYVDHRRLITAAPVAAQISSVLPSQSSSLPSQSSVLAGVTAQAGAELALARRPAYRRRTGLLGGALRAVVAGLGQPHLRGEHAALGLVAAGLGAQASSHFTAAPAAQVPALQASPAAGVTVAAEVPSAAALGAHLPVAGAQVLGAQASPPARR